MGENIDRFFVLTGGPGSGKSTLMAALRNAGYGSSVEAGRGVIQDQVAIGGRAVPWDDRLLFAELMLSWDMRSYHDATVKPGLAFFDRGVPDVVGYLRMSGLPVPVHMQRAAEKFRYHRRVFVAPPWEEIFAVDAERKQDFAEAVQTYSILKVVYSECGYDLVELPRVSVGERVKFVLDAVQDDSGA